MKRQRTCMSLKHLNNLATLQIPNVRLVILAPRDDQFSSRHAEARRYAVLCIRVPSVRLQAARSLVIP